MVNPLTATLALAGGLGVAALIVGVWAIVTGPPTASPTPGRTPGPANGASPAGATANRNDGQGARPDVPKPHNEPPPAAPAA